MCNAIFHTFVAFEGDALRPLHLRDEALDLGELVADLEVRRLERDGLLEALLRHVLVEGAPGGSKFAKLANFAKICTFLQIFSGLVLGCIKT